MTTHPVIAIGQVWVEVDKKLSTGLHGIRNIPNGIFGYFNHNERRDRPSQWKILEDSLVAEDELSEAL